MSMNNKPIRTALLGAGYISSWHADALKRTPGVDLVAVCDLSRGAAEGIANAYGAPHVFTSLGDLLAANVADCVHVLTPPHLHADATAKILEAGLSAFVEKPFTLSSDDCRRLEALAQKNNVALGVNHNFLMLPSYDRLKADIETRLIGPIDSFEANWQFPLPPLRSGPYNLWMLRAPENILFEIGPHLFAFVADLFGELKNISVSMRNPVTLPGGVGHYQSWRIAGVAKGASVVLNLSLVEGEDNRSIRLRGLGAVASYNFAEDSYLRERASMQDIVAGPLARQLSVAGQAMGTGFSNAFRQLKSLNGLAPYGLSIQRAVDSFYASLKAGAPVDRRLSAGLAANATAMIEQALDVARPQFMPKAPPPARNVAPAKGETTLVIGGTGFIGRALCHALADKGYDVRVFSRGSGGGFDREDGRITVFTGSLKSDDDLRAAMEGVRSVFHLARATETSWEGYLENDVGVTKRIGEACLAAGVARLVYTGTIDSYDASQPDRPINEETPFDHDLTRRNLYARSKAACEAELKKLESERGLPLVIARPGIVIGEGGPLQHWGIAMWRGATACKLWGDGKNIMPFVLVDDVADGLVLALETDGAAGASFNLIGEPMLSSHDYFAAIEDAYGVAMRAKPTPLWTYYMVDMVKYWLKRYLVKKQGLTEPSFRDWKSRAQLSPYANETAKSVLGWTPEQDKQKFVERGVATANLFGVSKS
ncbi:NAD-dependent epimerase/dehydratase family protein [Marinicaulis aureus]|uniref:NAD-dependent epimerase/dehydratase family protein n=1 Tax=Hyphococcus aureus TaxID=2666033 RepID=A0ABW1L1C1_9PROT